MTDRSVAVPWRRSDDNLVFFAISWELIDAPGFNRLSEDDVRRSTSKIRVTGVAPNGQSVCVDVLNPPIRVYVRNAHGTAFGTLRNSFIEQKANEMLAKQPSQRDESRALEQYRVRAARDFDGQIVSHSVVMRRFLQGVRQPVEFVEILVVDNWARRALYKAAVLAGLNTANERVEPCLDFRVRSGLSAACWMRAVDPRDAPRTRVNAVRSQIFATASSLARTSGTPMSVAPMLVASVDIEVFSESGDFPCAEKPNDIITIIGVHLSRAHEPEAAARIVMFVAKPCDALDGCEIRASASERAMLCDFIAYMGNHVHPEVYLTYNGFGFDWGYIYDRASKVHRLDVKGIGAYDAPRKLDLVQKDKRDGRKLSYFPIAGALNLDVMIPIGDDYKLPSYKLDAVAEHFLHLNKVDMSVADIFHKTRPDASPSEVAEVVSYCVRDVELPLKLTHQLSLLLNKIADSEIVNTTLNDLVTRGQGIKIFSYIIGLCHREGGALVDDRPMAYNKTSGYEGAFVKQPLLADDGSIFHCRWPIIALDVGSLYPTIMRNFNLCFSTHQQDDSQVLANPRVFEWIENNMQERHTFDQQMSGLLPGAMRSLREQRQGVRAQQKMLVDKDSLEFKVLEARQLSIKVVMNSAYGALGAGEKSMLANVPVAKTITYLGRCIIQECAHHVEETYGYRSVYSDTDSIYVEVRNVELASNHEAMMQFAFDMGATLEKAVSAHIRSYFHMVDGEAFVLECEDVMRGLLIPTKKRYCCRLYKSPTEKGKLLIKGLSVKRRDSCKLFQDTLSRILERAIDVRARNDAKTIIIEELDNAFGRLLRNEIPIEQLATSKALRAKYEGVGPVHFAVAEKRRARGETVRPGERISFVYVQVAHERSVRTQGDRAEDPAYVIAHGLKIDYAFYLESQMRGPCEQLLVAFWPGVSNYLKEWMQRLRGQKSIRSFFAVASPSVPVAAVVTLVDDDDDVMPLPAKRARVYDGIPCEVLDEDSD